MDSTDTTQRDQSVPQTIIDAENRRNRSIIADAVKQMVLIVISLGFPNAYMILAKPDEVAEGKGMHFFQLSSNSLLIFVIYVLVGTRFLLTSWLYLSTTYREDNPRKLRILPDAIGIFVTGVIIGVQSCYASENSISDFFQIFCLVLLIDVVFSLASVGMNWRSVRREGLAQELAWICNNVVFGIATMTAVLKSPQRADLMILFAFFNCAISFGISWFGYFRAKRVPIGRASR